MEKIDELDLKLDSLSEVTRSVLDAIRELIFELKKQGDVLAIQLAHQNKEIDGLKAALKDASDARKEIYARLEKQERHCASRHSDFRALKSGGADFDTDAAKWFQTQAGKLLLWGASIVIAVILTRLAGRVL